jgi:hypothetical protein
MYCCGLISGPKEPPLELINYYLRPLMDDLVVAWDRGYHFSRTPSHIHGRNSRCAIATVVADLPTARKSAQFAAATSHSYCFICKCHHKSTLGRVDCHAWEMRSSTELRSFAETWKNAPHSKDQINLFQDHGVRWSEFWRLPYWDPVHQLVVDPMHCILEGLAQQHTREVLGLTMSLALSKPTVVPAFTYDFATPPSGTVTVKENKLISEIHTLLTAALVNEDNGDLVLDKALDDLREKLMRKTINSLKYVAVSLNSDVSRGKMRKKHWVEELVMWVSVQTCTVVVVLIGQHSDNTNPMFQTSICH